MIQVTVKVWAAWKLWFVSEVVPRSFSSSPLIRFINLSFFKFACQTTAATSSCSLRPAAVQFALGWLTAECCNKMFASCAVGKVWQFAVKEHGGFVDVTFVFLINTSHFYPVTHWLTAEVWRGEKMWKPLWTLKNTHRLYHLYSSWCNITNKVFCSSCGVAVVVPAVI